MTLTGLNHERYDHSLTTITTMYSRAVTSTHSQQLRLPVNKKLRALQALREANTVSVTSLDETLGFFLHCRQMILLTHLKMEVRLLVIKPPCFASSPRGRYILRDFT